MLCSNCRKTISNDSVFCEYCGTKLTSSEESASAPEKNISVSMLTAGNLENELRHIQNKIKDINTSALWTRVSTVVYFLMEVSGYLLFVIFIILLLCFHLKINNDEIIKIVCDIGGVDKKELLYEESELIFHIVTILKTAWFFISIFILSCAVFFTSVRRQSLKVIKQNNIIKKIINSLNDLISYLKAGVQK